MVLLIYPKMKERIKKLTTRLKARFIIIGVWFRTNDLFLPILNIAIGIGNIVMALFKEGNAVIQWSAAGFSLGVGAGLLLVIPIRKQVKKQLNWMQNTSQDMIEEMESQRDHMKRVNENMNKFKNALDFEQDKK